MTAQFDTANLTVESALAYMDNAVSNEGYTLDEVYNAIRTEITHLRKGRKIDTVEAGDLRIRLNEAHTRAKKIAAEVDAAVLELEQACKDVRPTEMPQHLGEATPDGTSTAELVEQVAGKISRKTRTAALQAELEWLKVDHSCTPIQATAIVFSAVVAADAAGKVSPSAKHRVHSGLERAAAAFGVPFRW